MATRTCTTFSSLLLLLFLFSAANFAPVTSSDHTYEYLLSSQPFFHTTVEKQSHFRFYWHDILSGPNPTAVTVAEAPGTNTSSTFFGLVAVIDDALTVGPDANSKVVGRAQGLYASAGLKNVGLLMLENFVLTDGKYNGSTISIMGHNPIFSAEREMPIVGGSGLFRFARGYVQLRTYWFDTKSLDAVVEYNVYVNHY
ncbi:Dirigent protein 19 [Carex littledalei]|uniref:Dirigent protein n=1 Tax=Carex littledalei TaxID=544730 RepID=A0A833RBK9_9POAL|nr:Dirigent protein 19 [Carex littledalei]